MKKYALAILLIAFHFVAVPVYCQQQNARLIIVGEGHFKNAATNSLNINCNFSDYKYYSEVPLKIEKNNVTGSFKYILDNNCQFEKMGIKGEVRQKSTTDNTVTGNSKENYLNLVINSNREMTTTETVTGPNIKPVTYTFPSTSKDTKKISLKFKDGAFVTDSVNIDGITAKTTITLKLCSKSDKIKVEISPTVDEIIKMNCVPDHSHTGREITKMKKVDNGKEEAGLTLFKMVPKIDFTTGSLNQSFFLHALELTFVDPVIYVASEYPVGSCAYNATLQHEREHEASFKDILLQYHDKIECALNSADFPNPDKPIIGKDEKQADSEIRARLHEALDAIFKEMQNEAQRKTNELDSPENYAKVHSKCSLAEWK